MSTNKFNKLFSTIVDQSNTQLQDSLAFQSEASASLENISLTQCFKGSVNFNFSAKEQLKSSPNQNSNLKKQIQPNNIIYHKEENSLKLRDLVQNSDHIRPYANISSLILELENKSISDIKCSLLANNFRILSDAPIKKLKINLAKNTFGDRGIYEIINYIGKMQKLEKINLIFDHCTVTDQTVTKIVQKLKALPSLKEIKLSLHQTCITENSIRTFYEQYLKSSTNAELKCQNLDVEKHKKLIKKRENKYLDKSLKNPNVGTYNYSDQFGEWQTDENGNPTTTNNFANNFDQNAQISSKSAAKNQLTTYNNLTNNNNKENINTNNIISNSNNSNQLTTNLQNTTQKSLKQQQYQQNLPIKRDLAEEQQPQKKIQQQPISANNNIASTPNNNNNYQQQYNQNEERSILNQQNYDNPFQQIYKKPSLIQEDEKRISPQERQQEQQMENQYGKGFALLKNFGYKVGAGLGKNQDGITEPIKASNKQNLGGKKNFAKNRASQQEKSSSILRFEKKGTMVVGKQNSEENQEISTATNSPDDNIKNQNQNINDQSQDSTNSKITNNINNNNSLIFNTIFNVALNNQTQNNQLNQTNYNQQNLQEQNSQNQTQTQSQNQNQTGSVSKNSVHNSSASQQSSSKKSLAKSSGFSNSYIQQQQQQQQQQENINTYNYQQENQQQQQQYQQIHQHQQQQQQQQQSQFNYSNNINTNQQQNSQNPNYMHPPSLSQIGNALYHKNQQINPAYINQQQQQQQQFQQKNPFQEALTASSGQFQNFVNDQRQYFNM